ncbi:MAG TPA: hypothetical protein VHE35_32210, partial [Kofleriaceae bacterium]|nr:hypothetical protein [Kofleriaceae bacterium]
LIEWTALSVVPAPLAGATGPGAAAGTAAAGATTTTPPAGTAGTDGFDVRLGFGARRVLRAVEPDSSAAIELYVEGGGGVTRTWWNGGGTLTRPDLSVGAGWQIRGFQAPLLAIRLAVKVIVQPPIDDAATASLCHGTCPPAGHHGGDTAFIGQFGVSW